MTFDAALAAMKHGALCTHNKIPHTKEKALKLLFRIEME